MINLLFAMNIVQAVMPTVKISFGHHQMDTITFEHQSFPTGEMPTLTYVSSSGKMWGQVLTPKFEKKYLDELRQLTQKHGRSIASEVTCAIPFAVEEKSHKKAYCMDGATQAADRAFGEWILKVQQLAGVRRK